MTATLTRDYNIAFEGIDGSGKTTQAMKLQTALAADGYLTCLCPQPSNGHIGQLIRKYLTCAYTPPNRDTLALLFAADRTMQSQATQEEWRQFKQFGIVVSDRSVVSSIVYQGMVPERAQGLGSFDDIIPYGTKEWLWTINGYARHPGLVFLLEVEPEVAMQRITQRSGKKDVFEQQAFLRRAAAAYLRFQAPAWMTLVRIHATGSESDIARQVLDYTRYYMNTWEQRDRQSPSGATRPV